MRSRRRRRDIDPELAAAWKAAVVHRGSRCLMCGGRAELQAHHVIGQQVLRRYARELKLKRATAQRVLWDRRNGVPVCRRCHERHTCAYVRIPRARLPNFVFAYVAELDARTPGREPMLVRLEDEYPV
jgi:hypothetical protein